MEKAGLNDSATSADQSGQATDPARKTLLSKTFKDGAIYLFQRGDYKKPIWFCRLKVPGVKGYIYRSTRSSSEHQAFKFADDLYNQLLVKSLTGENPVGKRMGPVIDAYLKRLEPQKERLSIHYKILLMKRAKPFLERKTFEEMSTALLSRLVDYLAQNSKKGSLSPNSIKRIYSDLKHFLNWCVEEGHLAAMPKPPKVSGDPARRPHFNSAEWSKILKAMGPYLRSSPEYVKRHRCLLLLYVLILGETGIRVGEARNLRWRDLREIPNSSEPNKPNIAITVKGKTGIREVVASRPKIREAMGVLLNMRMKDLNDEASDIYRQPSVPLDSYIFCDKQGRPIASFKKSFATFLKEIGLTTDSFGRRRTLYSLRHTYATMRLEAGVNHYTLARNMGTSVAMLEQYYGHTTNVSMVDELTKPRARRAKAQREANNELAWLVRADGGQKGGELWDG